MDLNLIWQDYGLDKLEEGIARLFPEKSLSLEQLFSQVMSGDIFGALGLLFQGSISDFLGQAASMKNIFIWLVVLGIVSSLMTHFVEIFDKRQVADMSFYFMYLLFTTVLLKCFQQAADTAAQTIENITLFVRLLVPAYLLSVGVSSGAITAGASCQLMLFVIYGVEYILSALLLPLIYSFCMLSIVNGIWIEEKLSFLIEFLGKLTGWVLKGALGVVTGIGVFQRLIAPVVDSARNSAFQKLVSAIPGVGAAAGGVAELVLGSAVVIRNSIGVILLLLLLLLCALPLLKIAVISGVLKCAAAFMGIVSDKRITACADKTGDAGLLLLRTTGTAMLLFLIAIAVTA
ncbi:stage III sporulation protein AE [Acetatifactor muris]|jgi:stage III sporulation protein AE|uniref:Stage III sporulation protein AE n=1 Tax=Acetatifactor muris TaxID=879566 RepID=A0A2K4ZEH8_9FIRM|nr:stage III sporulation protein AE [Acetatifactor muris]MCI8798610.1 hypothetical protein [Lachnospiraceae bacterium]MCR2048474.1 stage III sporulation protein AE [Acetatifactor muris]SOY28860.1 Stage III sporulation protein AE precursor [Acetatifactor muris]